jgi:hypothetical protein
MRSEKSSKIGRNQNVGKLSEKSQKIGTFPAKSEDLASLELISKKAAHLVFSIAKKYFYVIIKGLRFLVLMDLVLKTNY